MRTSAINSLLGITAVMGLLLLSGCTIAEKAPEHYLTEEYYAAPVLATVAQPADDAAVLPMSFNRTSAEPVKPAKGKPPKPVHIDTAAIAAQAAAAASAASSQAASSEPAAPDKIYDKTVTDDKKETFHNVEVSASDVILENKYITGDLTVTRDASYSLTLINCKIEGELIVNSPYLYELELEDCMIRTLRLAAGDYIDVALEGRSLIEETILLSGTKASLYAYNIEHSYSGYKNISLAKSAKLIELILYGVSCQTLTVSSESTVSLADSNPSYVEAFNANAPVTVEGAARITKCYVRSDGVKLYGEPKELIYDKAKYTVELL